MNILIINQPLNNRGDESAHKGLVRHILRNTENVNIKVLFVNSNQDSINQFSVNSSRVEYINIKSFKLYYKCAQMYMIFSLPFLLKLHPTIRKVIEIYKSSDKVVCAPGGICMGGFQNWGHLFYLKLAKYTHKSLAYYGRSFGPFPTHTFKNARFKKISMEMLSYFSYLSIRDNKTEDLAKEMNINYIKTVDSAFLDTPCVTTPNEILEPISGCDYMVFVPNILIWHFAYKGKISLATVKHFYREIVSIILNKYPNIKIVMLPQTFNYGIGDDINFFKELASEIDIPNIFVVNDSYSSDIQQSLIKNAKFLIGARYHSVVFSVNQQTPFIALSYEHKISGLLETLSLSSHMVEITHALESSENISKALDEIKKQLDLIETFRMEKNLLTAKTISKNAFEIFKQDFLN